MAALHGEGRGRSSGVAICCMWLAALVAGVYGNCSQPPRMEYGELMEKFLSLEEYPVGTRVTYKCRPGYVQTLSFFKHTIQCLETLQWSFIAEFCKLKDCGNPGEPQNGIVEVPEGNSKFGSIVIFHCNTGFRLVGRSTRTCTASGWSNAVPECEPAVCPPPPDIANGKNTGSGQEEYYYLSGVTYSCNAEYMELIGSRLIHCTETGDWSDPAPICKDRRCPQPFVDNGRKIAGFKSLYLLGDVVEFRCNEGFLTKDSRSVTCGEKNTWEPPVPVCKPITCGKPPAAVNGSHSLINQEQFKYHERVTYKCDSSDLSLIGQDTIQCVGEEHWSGPAPRCKDVLCEIPAFPNGTKKPTFRYPYRYKHTITLQCNEFFSPKGPYHVECNENSMWIPKPPVCKDLRCPYPVIENGTWVPKWKNNYVLSDVVKFECLEAFKMEGQAEIRCGEENEWSPAIPVCRPIICDKPPIITNGTHNRINQEEFRYGHAVEYQCNSDNLSLIGRKTINCTHNENWDHPAPRCKVVHCKNLQLENGNIISAFQLPYKYGNTIKFECHKNFQMVGQQRATCREDSKWDVPMPRCQRTTCPDPVVENGDISVTGRRKSVVTFPVYTQIEVICTVGYTLVGEGKMSCNRDFTWSKKLPTCSPITCPKPEIEHGKISDMLKPEEEYQYADKVEIQCDPNYTLKGHVKVIQCTDKSEWSFLPTCEPVICREPEIQNGHIIPARSIVDQNAQNEYRVADKAEVRCDEGYFLHGKNEILCQQDSTWSSLPTCDFVCCNVQESQNGQIDNIACKNVMLVKPQSTELMSNVKVQCDGDIIKGTNNFQCRTYSDPSEPAACKPDGQTEAPAQHRPKFVALGKPGLSEEEVLGLKQNTTIATSPIQICEFVAESMNNNWEKMEFEEKYTHLQMRKLCQEIIKKMTKSQKAVNATNITLTPLSEFTGE